MPSRFLEIPVFLGDYFIMPHPVHKHYTARVRSVQTFIVPRKFCQHPEKHLYPSMTSA